MTSPIFVRSNDAPNDECCIRRRIDGDDDDDDDDFGCHDDVKPVLLSELNHTIPSSSPIRQKGGGKQLIDTSFDSHTTADLTE